MSKLIVTGVIRSRHSTNYMKKFFSTLTLILVCCTTQSHSGRTDSRGGHYNRKTGVYHYHNGGGKSVKKAAKPTQFENSMLLIAQRKLNELGYICGTPDGILGSKTKLAIIEFQESKGLIADGILGAKTKKELGLN